MIPMKVENKIAATNKANPRSGEAGPSHRHTGTCNLYDNGQTAESETHLPERLLADNIDNHQVT